MKRTLLCLTMAAGFVLAADLPRVDLHVHIDDEEGNHAKDLTPSAAAAISKKLGVRFGVLAEGGCGGEIHDNASLLKFIDSLKGQPMWAGLQVYGFDWGNCLSKENLSKLDYISADALVFPDGKGKNILLWTPEAKFDNPEEFMDRYVDFNVRVLSQPIQVWANPTYVPESMKAQYDKLWTPARMKRVIDAAVKNHVAIEINAHFQVPSQAFIRAAKKAGAKFTIASNGHVIGIGEIDFCLQRARECGLSAKDIWTPSRPISQ